MLDDFDGEPLPADKITLPPPDDTALPPPQKDDDIEIVDEQRVIPD